MPHEHDIDINNWCPRLLRGGVMSNTRVSVAHRKLDSSLRDATIDGRVKAQKILGEMGIEYEDRPEESLGLFTCPVLDTCDYVNARQALIEQGTHDTDPARFQEVSERQERIPCDLEDTVSVAEYVLERIGDLVLGWI